MSDTVDRQTRSRIMRAVPRLHTRPELVVRRSLHRLGFRFRVADHRLPGSPVPTENLVPPLCTLGIIEDLASAC